MNRILIVDDERLIRFSLNKVIDQIGDNNIVAGLAEDGENALAWLSRYYADLCITDVRMPKVNGLELLRTINERYPWMYCIVVSSYDDFSYIQQSMQLGAVDYVLKPVDRELLRQAINRSREKIARSRYDFAHALMLKRLPHHRGMLDKWIEQVKTVQSETLPIMVVDTLDMLESWVGRDVYHLNMLAMAWLEVVNEELKKEKLDVVFEEGEDIGLGEAAIPVERLRSYFRLCAVRRLEEGANLLLGGSKAAKDNPNRRVTEDVKKYIDDNYAKKLTLQELADAAWVSRNYIAILFKKTTGMTIWSYLVMVRMQKARDLLLHTPLKVYEIAGRVGYENSVHFSQLFKETYGLAPAEYKKRMES
ncbi:MAG: response regulator [Cohnella sp.]|nr:response regulator [Cohnella sp.]